MHTLIRQAARDCKTWISTYRVLARTTSRSSSLAGVCCAHFWLPSARAVFPPLRERGDTARHRLRRKWAPSASVFPVISSAAPLLCCCTPPPSTIHACLLAAAPTGQSTTLRRLVKCEMQRCIAKIELDGISVTVPCNQCVPCLRVLARSLSAVLCHSGRTCAKMFRGTQSLPMPGPPHCRCRCRSGESSTGCTLRSSALPMLRQSDQFLLLYTSGERSLPPLRCRFHCAHSRTMKDLQEAGHTPEQRHHALPSASRPTRASPSAVRCCTIRIPACWTSGNRSVHWKAFMKPRFRR